MNDIDRELHQIFNAIDYLEDQIIEYNRIIKITDKKDDLTLIRLKEDLSRIESEKSRLETRKEELSMKWWKENIGDLNENSNYEQQIKLLIGHE